MDSNLFLYLPVDMYPVDEFTIPNKFYALENVMQYVYKTVNGYCIYIHEKCVNSKTEHEVNRYSIIDSRDGTRIGTVIELSKW